MLGRNRFTSVLRTIHHGKLWTEYVKKLSEHKSMSSRRSYIALTSMITLFSGWVVLGMSEWFLPLINYEFCWRLSRGES